MKWGARLKIYLEYFDEHKISVWRDPKSERYRFRDFFSVPNFFETDSETFFGTKIFRDRFRDFFSVLIFFETGSETFFGTNFFSRPVPIPSKNCKNPGNGTRPGPKSTLIFWKFLRLVSIFFFGTKIFWDRFRDFFRYQNFSRPVPRLFSVPNFFETGSETFFGTKFFRFRFRYHQKKNEEFPGTGIPGTGTSHSECQCDCSNLGKQAEKRCQNLGAHTWHNFLLRFCTQWARNAFWYEQKLSRKKAKVKIVWYHWRCNCIGIVHSGV